MARLIFPVPVFLNRLAAPLCVFILGIICFSGSLFPGTRCFCCTKILHSDAWASTCRRAANRRHGFKFCSGSCAGAASRRCFVRRLLVLLRLLLRLLGPTATGALLGRRH